MHRTDYKALRRRWLGILLTLPLLLSCAEVTGPSDLTQGMPPPGMGVFAGTVSRGPGSALGGTPGASSSASVAGARVVVSQAGGSAEVTSMSTNAEGRYRIFLPPGTYLVTLAPGEQYLFTKDLPASVSVTDGQTTTLDVLLDTGIR